jgi:hypothetical protein
MLKGTWAVDGLAEELRRVLAEGEVPARLEAFSLLCERFPGAPEFERAVLDAAWTAGVPELRAAAVLAARYYPSEAALAATLDAMKSGVGRREATCVLRVSSRPGLSARLLEELDAAVAARDRAWSRALLRALSLRREPEVARRAAGLLDSHGADAAALLSRSDEPALLGMLADRVGSRDPGLRARAVEAAFKLGPVEAWERLSPFVLRPERPSSDEVALIREVFAEARRWNDERWPRLALEVVEARAGGRAGGSARTLLGGEELPEDYPIEPFLAALADFAYAPAGPALWAALEAGRLDAYPLASAIAKIEGPGIYPRLLLACAPWMDAPLAQLFFEIAEGADRARDVEDVLSALPAGHAARRSLERLRLRLSARYNEGE